MSETQDTVEITLPESKSKVTIRNYTNHKDDERYEELLQQGVNLTESQVKTDKSGNPDPEATEASVVFPLANISAARASYIPRLVQSIDDDTNDIKNRLDSLRSKDYQAVEEKVNEIVEEHSPKAKKAGSADSKS